MSASFFDRGISKMKEMMYNENRICISERMKGMIKQYLLGFLEEFSYEEEDRAALTAAFEKIAASTELYEEFAELLKRYEEDMNCDFEAIREAMKETSAKAGVHEYTGQLLLFICLSKTMRDYYKKAGLNEEIWFTTVCDLKYKMVECKEVYKICGTFVAPWFDRFYKLERFGFEKLQFEFIPFGMEYNKNGVALKPDSTVINVHIPRTGARLDREGMVSAYQKAADFFREKLEGNPIVFVCWSWLLFPRNKEILSETSNLYAFISDFDVFYHEEYPDYSDVWRLFDVNYDGNVDHLPQNTSLRRAYADWIRKGEKTGFGYGVYVYEKKRS